MALRGDLVQRFVTLVAHPLEATISYEQEETQLARSILDQCHPGSEERQVFEGALLWKEKRYTEVSGPI